MGNKIMFNGFVIFVSLIILLLHSTSAYSIPARWSFHKDIGTDLKVMASFKNKPDEVLFDDFVLGCKEVGGLIPADANDWGMAWWDDPTTMTLGVIEGSPGSLSLSNLGDGILSLFGYDEFLVPGLTSTTTDLFIGVDLMEWLNNSTPFNKGDLFTFVNGVSSSLSGFIVGTSEISFSSTQGWTTANPYTGSATADATIDGAAVPEPSTLFLLGSGLAGLFGVGRKRLQKEL